jgi:hypothetical protein
LLIFAELQYVSVILDMGAKVTQFKMSQL